METETRKETEIWRFALSSKLFGYFFAFLMAALWLIPPSAAANNNGIPTGDWKGSYVCQQGQTGLTLSIRRRQNGKPVATFSFYPLATNPRVPDGKFTMTPSFYKRNRTIRFRPKAWIKRPSTYHMVQISGRFSRDMNELSGRIETRGCKGFRVTRIAKELPKNIASAPATKNVPTGNPNIHPFARSAPKSEWIGNVSHQNGSTFSIVISKGKREIAATYPGTNCGSSLIAVKRSGKEIFFKEVTKSSFENCIDGGEITIRQKFRNSVEFSWRMNGRSAYGLLERMNNDGNRVSQLSRTQKQRNGSQNTVVRSVTTRSKQTASTTSRSLQGDWYGIAACRRKTQKINVDLFFRGGKNKGFVRSFARNIKITLAPEGPGKFRLIRSNGKPGKVSRLVDGVKVPQYLDFKFPGQCRSIFLIRHKPIKELAGKYARIKRQNILCDLVFERWLKTDSKQRDLAFKLKQQYSPLLSGYDYEKSAKQAIFSDPVFTEYFGKPAHKIDRNIFEKLENQIRGCIATKDYGGTIYAGTELYTAGSIKKVNHAILRSGKFSGLPLSDTNMFQRFKINRDLPRPTASKILGEWKPLLSEVDPLASVRKLIQSKARELSEATPEDIAKTLKEISVAAASAKQATPKSVSSLSKKKPTVMREDHLKGYTLLEAPFGHYIYVKNGAINTTTCRAETPVRVRLSSLLNLKYLRKKSAGGFFFYALDTLESACRSLAGARSAKRIQATFYFDGKAVGSASVRKQSYRVAISDVKLLVKPDIHPQDHPDFLFDKAAAAILGLSDGLTGLSLPALTLADLQNLANRGDLQAMTVLGLKEVHQIGKGKTANSTLIYALRRVPDMDKKLMRKASDNGSVVASYLLALELARSKKLFKDHAQSGVDISELKTNNQADFVHWYAKAKAGEVFWYRFLENVIKRWDVPIERSLQRIATKGFKGGTPNFQFDVNSTGLSRGRARKAFNNYVLSRCNKFDRFFFSEDHGNNPAAVLLGSYEVRGNACFAKMGGPYPFQIIQTVDQISNLKCTGSDTSKKCTFTMQLKCRWDSSSNDPAARRHSKLVLGTMCRLFEIPVPVSATFTRGPNGWGVSGKPKFGR